MDPEHNPNSPQHPWLAAFPDLSAVDDPDWRAVACAAQTLTLPGATEVFREGDPCSKYILVVDGCVRVYKTFESGREMVLYRLEEGQTCVLTTSLLLAGGLYPASAQTEPETHAVLIGRRDFHRAFDRSRGFRNFVCASFGGRIRDMIMLLEAVAVKHVDVRLAKWLLAHSAPAEPIPVSHRELAFELGTAREVVSRQLKDFEQRGWVRLARKRIQVLDREALRIMALGDMV